MMNKLQDKYYRQFERPPFAPIFSPTDDEFRDPIAYVEKIRPIAEKYGVVKIRPPPSFQPPFAIDTDRFEFTPRIQKLNELDAFSRVKINFLNKIASFWNLQGAQFKVPVIDNKYVDLYRLHKLVSDNGGFEQTCAQKKWSNISKLLMGNKSQHGSTLKMHYQKVLLPYDQSGIANTSTIDSKSIEEDGSSAAMNGRRRIPESATTTTNSAPRPSRMMAGVASTSTSQQPSGRMMAGVPGRMCQSTATPLPKKIENVLCGTCGGGDDEERLLLCESCDDSYHIYCLVPALSAVPKGDWRCPNCVAEAVCKLDDGFGFEQSQRTYTLKSFGDIADKFKSDYFGVPMNTAIDSDQIETEYWRNLANLESNVSVKYGADLFSTDIGSGFPRTTDVDCVDEMYARHDWNLNNLPVVKNSVLSHINVDISGMMVPWVYVGMCFSTFCWHTEDHWTYSINYLHWGDRKVWYGIAGDDGDRFEKAMEEFVPELFEKQPDLLHHIVTMINPRLLMEKGINVHTVHQNAGEFIITFPRAYHAGYNEGYNFAEAVNFAPSDWLSMGRKCVDQYSSVHRNCVFSHDELVCGMAQQASDLDIGMSIATYHDMLRMVECERDARKLLIEIGVFESKRVIFETLLDDQRQCFVCKTTCYLSSLTCPCCPDRMACLRHYNKLCDICTPEKYRYTMEELPPLMKPMYDRTKEFEKWKDKVDAKLNNCDETQDEKPSFADFKSLLEIARINKFPQCDQHKQLIAAVKHAERYANVAEQLIAHKIRTRNRQQSLTTFSKKLSLDELKEFMEQLRQLPCIIPQLKAIEEFVDKIGQFHDDAKRMFERIDNSEKPSELIVDLRELFERALSFDLHLPDMLRLKDELERSQWLMCVDKVIEQHSSAVADCDQLSTTLIKDEETGDDVDDSSTTDDCRPISTDRLKSLITEGVNISSNVHIETRIARLQSMFDDAHFNESLATDLLRNTDKPSIAACERVIGMFKPVVGISTCMADQLKRSLTKAKDWIHRFNMAKIDGGTISLIEQLLTQSRQLSFDLESQLVVLRRDRGKINEFINKIEELFQNSIGYHSIADIIGPRHDLSALLEGQRCPLYPRRKRNRTDDWAIVDEYNSTVAMTEAINRMSDQETILLERLRQFNCDRFAKQQEICVCRMMSRSTSDRDLIVCRLCHDHFHASCIRWDPVLNGLPSGVYLCPRCLRGRRPRIDDVQAAVQRVVDDVTIPYLELALVRQLLKRVQGWHTETQLLLSQLPNIDVGIDQLTDDQKCQLNKLINIGLTLEISTDISERLNAWDVVLNPPTENQKELLTSVRQQPSNSSIADTKTLFAGIVDCRKVGGGGKRSHSPSSSTGGGRKKGKLVYHEDSQQCSAPNCLQPFGSFATSGTITYSFVFAGDSVSWVQCEAGCDQWFHLLCVGLTVQLADQLDVYTCFVCRLAKV